MKKTVSVILILLTLLSVLASCATDGDKPDTTSGTGTTTSKTTEDNLEPNVPTVNMDGRTFTFLTDNWWGNTLMINDDFNAQERNGDRLNDAKYLAKVELETKYNCKIAEVNVNGPTDAMTKLTNTASAGDNAYDVYLARMMYWQTPATQGQLLDLNEVPYLDFDRPWWDSNSAKELSIANKLFGVASDISLQDENMTSCIVFNKKLIEDYNLETPYGLVNSNKWTIDKFGEMCLKVSKDIDPIGTWDEKDTYGLLYQRDTLSAFLIASGETYGKKDADDIPYVSINDEKAVNVVLKTMDLFYSDSCIQVMNLKNYIDTRNNMFQQDQALFSWFYMKSVELLRTMDTNFGIIPVPKYSEEQKEWFSEVSSWSATVVCLPSYLDGESLDETCIMLEAYGSEARKKIMPAYYDVLLKGITARDEESLDMLDLIFQNRRYDIGGACNFGDLTKLIYLTMTKDNNVASYISSKIQVAENDIKNLVEKIQSLD